MTVEKTVEAGCRREAKLKLVDMLRDKIQFTDATEHPLTRPLVIDVSASEIEKK